MMLDPVKLGLLHVLADDQEKANSGKCMFSFDNPGTITVHFRFNILHIPI